MNEQKPSRKEQILSALARMLEDEPGGRITTASLARHVGVSEAALYRHFPSKAKMFEGLIDFIDQSVSSRISRITSELPDAMSQIKQIMDLMLGFTGNNPGITRLLNGDALTGENERLRQRIGQFYDRLESQLKQILRDAEFKENLRTRSTPSITANLLLAVIEGRIAQFVRSGFRDLPTEDWNEQWQLLQDIIFRP